MYKLWNAISIRLACAAVITLAIHPVQAESGAVESPFSPFSVPSTGGKAVKIHPDSERIRFEVEGQLQDKLDPQLGFQLPANATTAEMNQALQQHRIVIFAAGHQYELTSPLVIPSNTIIDFRGATLRLADGANCYLLKNANQETGDDHILLLNGRLIGNGGKQQRNYNGGYRTGYFGFGTAFTKVKHLVMDNFYIEDMNAYGIAYFLCENAYFSNFEFNQSLATGRNGDGITGVARRIYINGVKGYTNDDLVAVSTGKCTLQGNDAGIRNDDNLDVEWVDIRNVHGHTKNGKKTHVGIGVYMTAGRKIKKLSVDGLKGDFEHYVWRIQNYWPKQGDGFVGEVQMQNFHATASGQYGAVIDIKKMDSLKLSDQAVSGSTKNAGFLTLKNSHIETLALKNCRLHTAKGEGTLVQTDAPKSTIATESTVESKVLPPKP